MRRATADDGAACAGIYAPYVTETAVTFETEPPDAAELSRRIATAQEAHDWLVVETGSAEGPRVVGYAYGGTFRARPAYRWTAEVSIYLDRHAGGQGLGRTLYAALLDRLEALGYRTLVAGYTVPNEASERLHRGLGFEQVGIYRRVGVKHGAWQDVAWVQRFLGDGPPPGQDGQPASRDGLPPGQDGPPPGQ